MKFIPLIAALLALLVSPARSASPSKPNVVFIVIDNVDFGYMGKCYGGTGLTPHIDRIAERGVKFTRAYAVTPLCVPSRYTCLSGRYASRAHDADPAMMPRNDDEAGGHIALETNLPNLPKVMQRGWLPHRLRRQVSSRERRNMAAIPRKGRQTCSNRSGRVAEEAQCLADGAHQGARIRFRRHAD